MTTLHLLVARVFVILLLLLSIGAAIGAAVRGYLALFANWHYNGVCAALLCFSLFGGAAYWLTHPLPFVREDDSHV